MARIQLITNIKTNKWGLSKDVTLLRNLLGQRHQVAVTDWSSSHVGPKFHLNIHLELMGGRLFNSAARNVLIPNQEWFMADWVRQGKLRFNAVFCKTRHAVDIFKNLGFKDVRYVGHTSVNRSVATVDKIPEFYHFAGNSMFKNTKAIVDLWHKRPDYPTLHLFASNKDLNFPITTPNIKFTYGHVPEETVTAVLNTRLFALQPSKSEGYGHCIVEPMACGGVVISLDAPPMNEFPIILSPAKQVGGHWYGLLFEPTALEKTVDTVLQLPDTALKTIGENNRKWWHENDQRWSQTILQAIETLL